MTEILIEKNFSLNLDGDIFEEPGSAIISAIGHGVNLFGVMGGFASLVDRKFPDDAEQYRAACPFDVDDMGRVSDADVDSVPDDKLRLGKAILTGGSLESHLWVAHIASQVRPGSDARVMALYNGVLDAAVKVGMGGELAILRVPLIGGGIGGIDPVVAAHVIKSAAIAADDTTNTSVMLYLRSEDPATAAVTNHFLPNGVDENFSSKL